MSSFLDVGEVLHKLRLEVARKGEAAMRLLILGFNKADHDKNGYLSPEGFTLALNKVGYFLPQHEMDALARHFDRDKDGRMHYKEFVRGLMGEMNERRMRMVHKAFDKFDKNDDDCINAEDIKGTYNAKKHPKVMAGQMTETQVFNQFLKTFEGVGGEKGDGVVTWNEFCDYYQGISASIPYNDDYFVTMMENAWKIRESDSGVTTDEDEGYLQSVEQVLKEKIRQHTKGSESEYSTMRRVFKHFDLDNSGHVSFREWCMALERFGIVLKEEESQKLFDRHDTNKNGTLCYDEFLQNFYAATA